MFIVFKAVFLEHMFCKAKNPPHKPMKIRTSVPVPVTNPFVRFWQKAKEIVKEIVETKPSHNFR